MFREYLNEIKTKAKAVQPNILSKLREEVYKAYPISKGDSYDRITGYLKEWDYDQIKYFFSLPSDNDLSQKLGEFIINNMDNIKKELNEEG